MAWRMDRYMAVVTEFQMVVLLDALSVALLAVALALEQVVVMVVMRAVEMVGPTAASLVFSTADCSADAMAAATVLLRGFLLGI